jgi:hypothetical protein
MLLRGITKEMVTETLVAPEETGVGYKQRLLAYRTFGGRKVKVVYNKEGESYIIISVMWS